MKTLTTWNPFGELDDMQNRFNLFLGGVPMFPAKAGHGNATSLALPEWSPLVDITEDDQEYLFKMDLPEMKKEDVKVTVENGVLSISGERKSEKAEKKRKFHRLERSYGFFERTFTMPVQADAAKVAAEFKDGVLSVHLPKSPTAKQRTIDVKVD